MPPHQSRAPYPVDELKEIFGSVAGVADQKVDVEGCIKAADMMAAKMTGDQEAALLEVAHTPPAPTLLNLQSPTSP